jgi:outer membrane protein OmpA-like peptidoglycan-associated protein
MLAGATLALVAGAAPPTRGQFGDLVKQKLKQKAEQKASQGVDQALNKGEQVVTCVVTDEACIRKAKDTGQKVVVTDENGKPIPGADSAAAGASATGPKANGATTATVAMVKPGEGAWSNYDFVPGDRVVFFEDFTKDTVGDFPQRLELKRGNLEVVEWQSGRYLRSKEGGGGAAFYIPLPEVLPERFTVEFDYSGPGGNSSDLWFDKEGGDHNSVEFGAYGAGVARGSVQSVGKLENMADKLYRARIMASGKYVKVYVNEQRVANAPNANLGRSNKILVVFPWSGTKMISNIRIAAGGKKLYDALAEKGRVSTQGIYFDTGSDRIRPESTPTLKEIGQMLKEHPELKLRIEGHTDNVGTSAANQALSEKRADAVRQFLVTTYSLDPSRLAAKGLGATKPVSSNTTPEGQQNNRRVELVKT